MFYLMHFISVSIVLVAVIGILTIIGDLFFTDRLGLPEAKCCCGTNQRCKFCVD